MKKTMALCGVLFAGALMFAQKITVESVCADLAKNTITKGDFTQEKTVGKNNRKLKSNGKFIFSTDGIVWNTIRPFPSTLVLGADYMVQIGSDGTRKVTDARGNDAFKSVSSTLLAVFSNDITKLNQNFNVNFSAEADKWTVTLQPKDKTVASVMTAIVLKGSSAAAGSEIDGIQLNEANGGTVDYAFANQTHPKELTTDEKSLFKAD
ncbi:MAG: outer membrane lipoprotein carrier protein LolA [Treponema sp.]|nr:outer membrane lipoprotein carrier protein LolA [Candidatus Treponema equi]